MGLTPDVCVCFNLSLSITVVSHAAVGMSPPAPSTRTPTPPHLRLHARPSLDPNPTKTDEDRELAAAMEPSMQADVAGTTLQTRSTGSSTRSRPVQTLFNSLHFFIRRLCCMRSFATCSFAAGQQQCPTSPTIGIMYRYRSFEHRATGTFAAAGTTDDGGTDTSNTARLKIVFIDMICKLDPGWR
jgi:hypothetical protein